MPGDLSPPTGPTPSEAAARLANWGFLANPDLPDRPGPAFLLVALRPHPTLAHYDPELVEYWTNRDGPGSRRCLTRQTRTPFETPFAWGMIRISDRLKVSNEYLTFGGRLTAADVDGTTVAVFVSPAPLLRRGGHSQGWDAAADNLGAFLGRLMVAVDYVPGFEASCGAAEPLELYAAFVADTVGRLRASAGVRSANPDLWVLMTAEERRLRRDDSAAWAEGLTILHAAGLALAHA
jgi:hypothetical protein